MAFILILKPRARKILNNLDDSTKIKINAVLVVIKNDPFCGKKLEGELKGKYAVRAWPYRIVYQILKKELIVLVVDIGHRQGVYK